MKLFAGLSRTDYEDVFRAIGALIDERGWTNVSLTEVDEGLIVQVMIKASLRETKPHLETYLLTDNDLERVMHDAIARRRKKESVQQPTMVKPPVILPPPPPPGLVVEDRLASMFTNTSPPSALASNDEPPLPPMPTLDGLPTERPLGITEVVDEPPIVARPQATAPFLSPVEEDDEPLFAPAPMRLSIAPAAPSFDAGAARAAVVMAHIVAARLKSGMPMTGDDPDLASLLEQVRALDETGIGKG